MYQSVIAAPLPPLWCRCRDGWSYGSASVHRHGCLLWVALGRLRALVRRRWFALRRQAPPRGIVSVAASGYLRTDSGELITRIMAVDTK